MKEALTPEEKNLEGQLSNRLQLPAEKLNAEQRSAIYQALDHRPQRTPVKWILGLTISACACIIIFLAMQTTMERKPTIEVQIVEVDKDLQPTVLDENLEWASTSSFDRRIIALQSKLKKKNTQSFDLTRRSESVLFLEKLNHLRHELKES